MSTTLTSARHEVASFAHWREGDADRAIAMLRRCVGLHRINPQAVVNHYYCRAESRDARLWRRLVALGFAARFGTIVPGMDLFCVTSHGAFELLDLSRSHALAIGRLVPAGGEQGGAAE